MTYLNSIELLNLALELLKSERRDQVLVGKIADIKALMVKAKKYLNKDSDQPNAIFEAKCADVLQACFLVEKSVKEGAIPMAMRDALVKGVEEALKAVCDEAWDYYSVHDVNDTNPVYRTLYRTIVEYHYKEVSA